MHSFDDSQDHLEQLLAFPQVSIGDHCEAMLSKQLENTPFALLGVTIPASISMSSLGSMLLVEMMTWSLCKLFAHELPCSQDTAWQCMHDQTFMTKSDKA